MRPQERWLHASHLWRHGVIVPTGEDSRSPFLSHSLRLLIGMGNVLTFFELPNSEEMGRDENTSIWVQHLALEVDDLPADADVE